MCGYNSCLWLQTLLLTKDNTSECASAISWGGLQRLRRGVRGEAAGKLYLNLTGNVRRLTRTWRPNLHQDPSVKCCSVCGGRISIGATPKSKDSSNLATSCIFVARFRCVGICLFVRTRDNRESCADTSLSVDTRYVFYRRLVARPKPHLRPRHRIRIKGSSLAPLPCDISCTRSDMGLRVNRRTLFFGGGR